MSLVVNGLSKSYVKNSKALDNVSFCVNEGECIGIVGESGSGKSTLARVLVGLETYDEGQVVFNEKEIVPKERTLLREFRKSVQMIFQDPVSTLNPKLPILKSVLEPLDNYKEFTPSFLAGEVISRREMAERLLELVGLEKEMVNRYPDELSGGQKQRVSIARAISIEPSLLICDEPTASLDVTAQVEILRLLKKLQRKTKMTIVFISHDIRAVTFLCEKVIVLKDGSIIDHFELSEFYGKNRHPYTRALIKAAVME